MTDLHLDITAGFDRALFWEGGDSVRNLVVRLTARRTAEGSATPRKPLNIALVIDASGSMSGGKLEAAKSAAIGLAERLGPEDRLTLVSFASDVRVHLDAVPVTSERSWEIRHAIADLETRGSTNLSGGWFAGVDCAARVAEARRDLMARVIILSDGHANVGISSAPALWEHAAELRNRGVLTSTLGIGDGYDEGLLRGIAENGGGRLHDAELTQEIASVLLGELDDIHGAALEDVRLMIDLPPSTRIEPYGSRRITREEGGLGLALGALVDGIERSVVFKVTCPRAEAGTALRFDISASGQPAEGGARVSASAAPAILRAATGRENEAQERDTPLSRIVARAWSAHVTARAAEMNRERNLTDAVDYVMREFRHFERYVAGLDLGPEILRDLDILRRNISRPLSSRANKEMFVQASLSMESRIDRRGPGKAAWSARIEE